MWLGKLTSLDMTLLGWLGCKTSTQTKGWSGVAKVSCTLHHRGVLLILAYSWERPTILVAGNGRWGMFLFLLFLHFHSCSSFFPTLSFISSISSFFFLPFSGRWHKMTHKGWRVVKPQHNQHKQKKTCLHKQGSWESVSTSDQKGINSMASV